MVNETVKASVAMITFNHERFIAQAVESALAQQTDFDFEIVVHDDHSTDSTYQILSHLQRHYADRLRVFQNPANLGMVRNFAAALRSCGGTYVAWLEGDDYWTCPTKLKRQVEFLERHPFCAICCHRVQYVGEDGQSLGQTFPDDVREFSTIDDLLDRSFIQTCSAVVRRSAVPELPDWFETLNFADRPYFILAAIHGGIGYLDDVMAAYRFHHAGAWSTQPSNRRVRQTIHMLNRLKHHLPSEYKARIELAVARHHLLLFQQLRASGESNRALRHFDICRARGGAQAGLRNRDIAAVWIWRKAPALYSGLKRLCDGFVSTVTGCRRIASEIFGVLKGLAAAVHSAIRLYRLHGLPVTLRHAEWILRWFINYGLAYRVWVAKYDALNDQDRELIRARIKQMSDRPLLSVLMPVYNTPERLLRHSIDSVRKQLYADWELCIADDASTQPQVRRVLEEYRDADRRIRCIFRQSNGHIVAASNTALANARGDFLALLDHDDALAEHALFLVAETIRNFPDVDMIYSDEDKIDDQGRRFHPYFKTDWNPDLMLSHNMVSHLGVYRASLVRAIGGFREGFEGSQDYDLALRISERSDPSRIRHVPHVLYHWRAVRGSVAEDADAKPYAYDSAVRAIHEHLARCGKLASVTPAATLGSYRVRYELPSPPPLVSVIIATRDRVELLARVMDGLLHGTDYPNFEVIIVDNASCQPSTVEYLASITEDSRVSVIQWGGTFNFSAINNEAARAARGSVLCLLNNDVEVIDPDWLTEMVGHAVRQEVGAVGALLFFPNHTVQHAGVVLGLAGSAAHAFMRLPKTMLAPFDRARLIQDFSAVTAACMVLRRSVFEEVDGFDSENFPVAYNDVDLCLRIGERGYRIVWTPYAQLCHRSSATLGRATSRARRHQFQRDVAVLQKRWGDRLASDPFYNPNLALDHSDYRLAFPPRAPKPWKRTQK